MESVKADITRTVGTSSGDMRMLLRDVPPRIKALMLLSRP